ncbi:MAG: hypothetical protein ABII00_13690 [Elusimicrobiota bacterium]
MPSDTFRCPNCDAPLEKSAAAFVLGATGYRTSEKDPLPENVTCPSCGEDIPVQGMIEGRYDVKPEWQGTLVLVLTAAASFFLSAAYGMRFWPALGLGLAIAVAAVVALSAALWAFGRIRDALRRPPS